MIRHAFKNCFIRQSCSYFLRRTRASLALWPKRWPAGSLALFRTSQICENLYEGEAVFVPVGNHLILAEEIINLLADEPRRAKIGQSSRARAKEFQWDKAARIASAAFAESVGKSKAGGEHRDAETEK
jgi:hypothetical protein